MHVRTLECTPSAGGEAKITVRCSPPQGVDKTRWPIYSGYITINSTNGDALSIPYVGNAGSMREGVNIDDEAVTFWPRFNAEDVVTLPRPTTPGNSSYNDLSMNVNPYLPAKVLRFDIVAPPAAVSNGTADPPGNSSDALPTEEWLGRKTYGQAWASPYAILAASSGISAPFGGFLASGQLLPAGRYAILASALRLFADPASEDEADWQVVETVPFLLRYQE